jgi:glycosyltransferase involved in cell wall biosynthesis
MRMKNAVVRVLMLLENNPYPQDSRVLREAATLTEAGYEVTVIAPAARGQARHEVLDAVRVCRFPAPSGGNGLLGYLWEYAYSTAAIFVISLVLFLRRGFDVVHAHNPPDTLALIAAFYRLFGVRFVFDHHDLSPEMYYARFNGKGHRLIHLVLVAFEKLSCRLADHVIATNESYKAVEIQRDGVSEESITIVRNGPDLDRIRLVEPHAALRQARRTIIGYVGVMGFQDGVDHLLRAIRHLVYDLHRTDCFCVLIGQGDAWQRLRALTTELGLDDYVLLTGRVSDADMLGYLCAADICVDPDPSNPFNDRSTMIKMMEYMALGKPIVAFDLPEHRVSAQQAAVYVRPNDELEFARAIAALMDDPPRRRAMGRCGRRRVETTLAWVHSCEQLLTAYRRVLPQAHIESHRRRPNRVQEPGRS